MSTRRIFIASALASALTPSLAEAFNNCSGYACQAGVNMTRATRIYAAQRQSQWCWAASIQMLFAAGGHQVGQERIVQTAYGRLVNLPAFAPVQIAALTNRDWQTDDGDSFTAKLRAAYDAFAGVTAINNGMIVEALAQEQPMIVCNTHHAMLLTAVAYVPTPYGPNIMNVGFFDPWPGRGARGPDRPSEGRAMNIGGEITYIGLAEID